MYIVLELFPEPELATIVCNKDGINKVFDDYNLAEKEANDCQDGLVIEIS